MATTDEAAAPNAGSAYATQVAWYALEPGDVTERLNVSAASGLPGAEPHRGSPASGPTSSPRPRSSPAGARSCASTATRCRSCC